MAAIPAAYYFLAASTALSAYSAHEQGAAAYDKAKFESDQLKQQADLTAADGLRRATEQRRQQQIEISNARAAGGTSTDVSSLDNAGKIGGLFERNALEEIYGANLDAQQKRLQADATLYEGATAKRAGNVQAATTVFSSLASIYGGAGMAGKGTSVGGTPGVSSVYAAGAPTYRTTRIPLQ